MRGHNVVTSLNLTHMESVRSVKITKSQVLTKPNARDQFACRMSIYLELEYVLAVNLIILQQQIS